MNEKQRIKQRARVKKILLALKKLFPSPHSALLFRTPWELLVAVILSAQCTDKKVNEVTARLFKKYRTLDAYAHASQSDFEKDIYETGFYRQKAKHIRAAALMLKKQFHGRVPRTMGELLTFPGVARKTANIVLANAYGIIEGIAVDTHVKRICRLHGLTIHTNPNKIERDLMEIVPKKDWAAFSNLLIAYGRAYCPSRKHAHKNCPLSKI